MEIPTLITFARNDDLLFFEISLVSRLFIIFAKRKKPMANG